MASPFADAIMTSMIASMDPTIAMQRDAMKGYLETQQAQLAITKANTVREINELLSKAINDKADTVVITTYQKLLASLTA